MAVERLNNPVIGRNRPQRPAIQNEADKLRRRFNGFQDTGILGIHGFIEIKFWIFSIIVTGTIKTSRRIGVFFCAFFSYVESIDSSVIACDNSTILEDRRGVSEG